MLSWYCWFYRIMWGLFPHFQFSGRVWIESVFLQCLAEFTDEAIWAWSFLWMKIFVWKFSNSNRYRLIEAISYWINFDSLWFFKEFCIQFVITFISLKLFIIVSYLPFNICGICSDVTISYCLLVCFIFVINFITII